MGGQRCRNTLSVAEHKIFELQIRNKHTVHSRRQKETWESWERKRLTEECI